MKIYGEVVTFWTRHGYHVVPLIALNTSTRLIHSQPRRQMALIARREIPPAGGNNECRLYYRHGLNTFTAIVDDSRFNNSCLKSPASTLVDLTFQSRALRSFSLNQLRNLSL